MAYDKIISVKRRLDHCIGYVLNEEKASVPDGLTLQTALNCCLETAYQEMTDTKRRWDKRRGVLGYHLIHSYAPGEVTPQEAHDAGVEFARRLVGARFEAVVATHLDRDHIHCHIVFNSVSFVDGEKFRNDFKAYYGDIRELSNAVSRERGLSVIEPGQDKGQHYAEWNAQRQGKTTLRQLIRQDIDAALGRAYTLRSFWAELERQGYQIKRGENVKYTAIKPPGGGRFVRLSSLGESYTEQALFKRLGQARAEPRAPEALEAPAVELTPRRYTLRSGHIPRRRGRPRSFRGLYFYYLRLVRGQTPRKWPPPFAVRREVARLDQITRQFYFLRQYRIDTQDQLSMLGDALQAQIDALTQRRSKLYEYRRQGEDVDWELEQINQDLRPLRRELKLCRRIDQDMPRVRENMRLCREVRESRAAKSITKERSDTRWK